MDRPEINPKHAAEMRDLMESCRDYYELIFEEVDQLLNPTDQTPLLTENMLVGTKSHPVFTELHDVVDRLRAFMESAGGDYALGVEDGMQRAADIIETLIKRHEDN